jgi:DNA-directed RNA polymerase subunit omega
MGAEAYIVTESMKEKIPNIYNLNLLAAARAHAIERGSTPRISKEECGEHKPTVIALKEIEAGLIDMEYYYNQKTIEQRWKAEREQAGEKEGVEKEDDSFFPRSSNEVI